MISARCRGTGALVCVLCAVLAFGISACGADNVGSRGDEGTFKGEQTPDDGTGQTPPESGQSSCSMFDADSCGDTGACVPLASGIRGCQEHAVLEIGARCPRSKPEICVGGAICIGAHDNGSSCREICDPASPSCTEGDCIRWITIDGEDVGFCL